MAPEFPFPSPIDECYKATLHVLTNHIELGVDPEKLVLAGDSSGTINEIFCMNSIKNSLKIKPKVEMLWL